MEHQDDMQRDKVTTSPGDEPEKSLGQWLASNGFSLIVVAAALGYVLWKFDTDGILAIGKALVGLSFVIFIHELGHFLAAKWCDVNVTTFSIGFGPAIPGCWFQRGETTYKLSLLPLGGYVQMVGQVDGDEASDGSEDDPRSYRNKTVGQRMLIISAGVIMNAILAFVCFIAVYQGPGKDRTAAVINNVDSGSPAFIRGIRTEMHVHRVGTVDNPNFEDLMTSVVFSGHDELVPFIGQRPDDPEPLNLKIEPRLDKGGLRPVIGVGHSSRPELAPRRLVESENKGPYFQGSAASLATPGLQFGDRVIATTDPDDPTKLKDLPRDPRNQQKEEKDFFEFQRRMVRLAGKEITVRVAHPDGTTGEIKVPAAFHQTLGIRMRMGEIVAVRESSPAAKGKIEVPRKQKEIQYQGDTILKVIVNDAAGKKPIAEFADAKLDPERLPYLLQQCANQLRQANGKVDMNVTLKIKRHRTEGGEQFEEKDVTLDWDDGWRFDRIVPLHPDSPLAIPELGLAFHIKPDIGGILPDLVAENWLQPEDVIKEFQITPHVGDPEPVVKVGNNWAYVGYWLNHRSAPIKNVKLTIVRGKETITQDITPASDRAWPLADRGWVFMADERRQKADGIFEAIGLGLRDTWNNMKQVGQTLYGMITGRLSVKNLGGPITIAKTAYRIAGYDIWEFVFFMGLISINLAVINFLPIPVLDGGHMVFLFYEKLRGRQASEGVRVGATYAGLAIILSLMVFVIWLDLTRRP